MGEIDNYRQAIKNILREYEKIPYSYGDMKCKAVFDDRAGSYLLMTIGWEGKKRIHGCIVHIEIIGDKVWLQYDGTDTEIALELERAGIPKDKIVLGFHEPGVRPYTGYAVA